MLLMLLKLLLLLLPAASPSSSPTAKIHQKGFIVTNVHSEKKVQ
jgi:hypothetical protein